ncbi:probable inactive receptor kinase At2g26730 [Phragmites australis]|uniref:probable inactive receptor kinase At2g26730 n=1 Tax=Phragmites australis TaxID=29695 RepID=UPI002D76BE94|nr:probable inactive receptor kinase At2g26730 [Phragmites australis]
MAKVIAVLAAALVVLLSCCCCGVRGDEAPDVRASLVAFLRELAGGDDMVARDLGWNVSVDPCLRGSSTSPWGGTVTCFGSDSENDGRVKRIDLDGHGLSGTIDAALLCVAPEVRVVNVVDNNLRGSLPASISACSGLTHLIVGGNQLSGSLPTSLAQLDSLHVIDVSRNNFSGELPGDLGKLELQRFLANDNHFNGTIPDFNFTGLDIFNVSNNILTGPIPKNASKFGKDRFLPNDAGMCGEPLFGPCKSSPSPFREPPPSSDSESEDGQGESKSKKRTVRRIVMYLGYVLLGAAIVAFVLYKLCSKKRSKLGGGRRAYDTSKATTTVTTSASASKSAYSLPMSAEQSTAAAGAGGAPSASLVVLRRSGTASITSTAAAAAAKELRFEDLLKSPAELLGRGRFGSSYKVVVPGGAALAVKRVKDAAVGEEEFRRRMERVGRAKHPAVLPPLAFYCAMQEKLVVYEFQSNGSLSKLLHGSIESSQGPLDWPARLHIAARVADGMAFMHAALRGDGTSSNSNSPSSGEEEAAEGGPIAHGNLKASNILFTAGMDPCISEYGVTAPPLPNYGASGSAALRADVRAFGVLLLELLTGKAAAAQGDGAELARWVTSVIREEWTAEVFDRALLAGGDGSCEQRLVQLLQVAMRCVDASPAAAPPTMREVAGMVNAIREEDYRSPSCEA